MNNVDLSNFEWIERTNKGGRNRVEGVTVRVRKRDRSSENKGVCPQLVIRISMDVAKKMRWQEKDLVNIGVCKTTGKLIQITRKPNGVYALKGNGANAALTLDIAGSAIEGTYPTTMKYLEDEYGEAKEAAYEVLPSCLLVAV